MEIKRRGADVRSMCVPEHWSRRSRDLTSYKGKACGGYSLHLQGVYGTFYDFMLSIAHVGSVHHALAWVCVKISPVLQQLTDYRFFFLKCGWWLVHTECCFFFFKKRGRCNVWLLVLPLPLWLDKGLAELYVYLLKRVALLFWICRR